MIPHISTLIMVFFDTYVNTAMNEMDGNIRDALLSLAKSSFNFTVAVGTKIVDIAHPTAAKGGTGAKQ